MSAAASTSGSVSGGPRNSTPGGLRTGNQSVARIRTRNGASTSASRRPTPPRPTIPTVAPVRSRVGRRTTSRAACWARNSGSRRVQAIARPTACSETWSANTPEALVTVIEEPTTAGTRQWSSPAADDWIHRSRPSATTRSQGTGTLG